MGNTLLKYNKVSDQVVPISPTSDILLNYFRYGYNIIYSPTKKKTQAFGELYDDNKHLLSRKFKKRITFLFWRSNQPLKNGGVLGHPMKAYITKRIVLKYFVLVSLEEQRWDITMTIWLEMAVYLSRVNKWLCVDVV